MYWTWNERRRASASSRQDGQAAGVEADGFGRRPCRWRGPTGHRPDVRALQVGVRRSKHRQGAGRGRGAGVRAPGEGRSDRPRGHREFDITEWVTSRSRKTTATPRPRPSRCGRAWSRWPAESRTVRAARRGLVTTSWTRAASGDRTAQAVRGRSGPGIAAPTSLNFQRGNTAGLGLAEPANFDAPEPKAVRTGDGYVLKTAPGFWTSCLGAEAEAILSRRRTSRNRSVLRMAGWANLSGPAAPVALSQAVEIKKYEGPIVDDVPPGSWRVAKEDDHQPAGRVAHHKEEFFPPPPASAAQGSTSSTRRPRRTRLPRWSATRRTSTPGCRPGHRRGKGPGRSHGRRAGGCQGLQAPGGRGRHESEDEPEAMYRPETLHRPS